ncbi:MAG TPA: V-type ATPase subunit [Syntrophorhabdaceae bacterium]|nr:V-type ATPase subunit [Syntrophorhabdaceae bacterium]HPP05944.1 V-type ATPase subunit [Syntrophorhabdaceae bacterium]
MQDVIAEDKDVLTVKKRLTGASDLDYLAALLHARYSKMAKGERLIELSRIQNLSDFFQSVYPDKAIADIYDFQKKVIFDFISELYSLRAYLTREYGSFIDWLATRFQLENLKILLKGFFTKTPFFRLRHFIVNLPGQLSLNTKKLSEAETIDDFIKNCPRGFFQDNLKNAIKIFGDRAKPFYIEACLDSAYFKELILKTSKLKSHDRDYIKAIINQEIDIFHLMLITRGVMQYNLPPELIKIFHVEETAIPKRVFTNLLKESDLGVFTKTLEGRVIDVIPVELIKIDQTTAPDLSILETLAWKRFYRLCNKVFYVNHMGFGAIVGYIGLRRIETINLIALSEGIKGGYGPDFIRKHLILKDYGEAYHV